MEFEIRYYLDPRNPRASHSNAELSPTERAKKIHKKYPHISTEKTASVVHNDMRRIIQFGTKSLYQQKINKPSLGKIKTIYGGCKVNHAEEIDITDLAIIDIFNQEISNTTKVRIRIRNSYQLTPKLRLDVTLIKECFIKDIIIYKNKLIYDTDDWNKEAPWDMIDWIEFEVESDEKITIDMVYDIYLLLLLEYDINYLKSMAEIAKLVEHPNKRDYIRYGLHNSNIGFHTLLPKAVELSLEEYNKLGYYDYDFNVRIKIEGVRTLVFITDKKVHYINDNNIKIDDIDIDGVYLFDCEKLGNKLYILHTLIHDSNNLSMYKEMDRNCDISVIPLDIQYCHMKQPSETYSEFYNKYTSLLPTDGLILSTNESYFAQKCIKWKPPDKATIDFLVVRCPDFLIGKRPYIRNDNSDNLWLLFVSVSSKLFKIQGHRYPVGYSRIFKDLDNIQLKYKKPVQFKTDKYPYLFIWSAPNNLPDMDKKIVELGWKDDTWLFHRIRVDRHSCFESSRGYMGNNIITASSTWKRIHNTNFTIDKLYTKYNIPAQPLLQTNNELENIIPNINKYFVKYTHILIDGFEGDVQNLTRSFKIIYKFINGKPVNISASDHFDTLADMYISFDKFNTKLLKYGGYFISKDKVDLGFKFIEEINGYNIYKKLKRGYIDMDNDEVKQDNFHLHNKLNINQQYKAKFTKTLGNNIPLFEDKYPEKCPFNYYCNQNFGIIITIMEALTDIQKYLTSCTILSNDFPQLTALINILINCGITVYRDVRNDIDLLIDLTESNTINEIKPMYYIIKQTSSLRVPSGKQLMIPYQDWNNQHFIISGGRKHGIKYVDFGKSTFIQSIRGFNMYVRSQAYRNANLISNYDDCWDCKYCLITIKKFEKVFKVKDILLIYERL